MTATAGLDPARAAAGENLLLRDATPGDNDALIDLAAACPMRGDIELCMDRSPDFFALSRLEGDRSRVGVVSEWNGRAIGCVAVAARQSYVNGAPTSTAYASDLKVHPLARRTGAADALTLYARGATIELCGPDSPLLCTILAGNAAMERRARGPRGMPVLSRFATLAVLAVPLLWERRERPAGVRVRHATENDLEPMALAWRQYARDRQFADERDAESFNTWIRNAPGLALADYLLATDAAGRILGFMGVWDQREFKQMRVSSYSRRLAFARRAINLIAPLTGTARLPEPGSVLPALATVHVCAREPVVLRALLLEAYRRYRGPHYAFLTLGLDARDPLLAATAGLLSQPTRVDAYVTSGRDFADPGTFAGRLLHYETALV